MLLTFSVAHAADVHNGEDVIRAMHERYASSWYKTVTFTQKSTTFKPDGTSSFEMWYEAASLPGKLRIDIGTPADNNGYLMVDGTLSIFKKGALVKTDKYMNILLVLGFDAYTQDAAKTIQVVKDEGYDLAKFHEDSWDGKPAYVVGADKGDLKAKQFWVEKDNLLFVRVIEPSRGEPVKVDDIRFIHYEPLAGAWIAAGVEVHADGKKVFSEDYTDIQGNVKLDAGTFDPDKFTTTHWEK
ncbi:MAG TPA: hypothetical protein VGG04_17875 [Candidatus Sulfotelmatobacter sp.]